MNLKKQNLKVFLICSLIAVATIVMMFSVVMGMDGALKALQQ
jgi:hypothetical protein